MTTDSAPPETGANRPGWVVFMMTLLMMFSFLDRGLLALLVEPVKEDLGINDTQMSLLLGFAFASFYALLGVPFGILADRGSRVRLIGFGLFLWTVATALSGRAQSFFSLFLLRMGVGVGEATLGPAAPSIITDSVPRERLATSMSIYATGIYIGSGLATMLGGGIAAVTMRIGEVTVPVIGLVKPWQMVFLLVGVAGFLPLLLLITTLKEPARRGSGATEPPPKLAQTLAHYRQHRKTILWHHVGFATLAFSGYGVGSWLPAFMIRRHGWSIEKVALWLGLNGIVTAVVGVLAGGMLADALVRRGRTDGKLIVAVLGGVLWFPFGIAYPLVESDVLSMAAIAAATFCATLGIGCAIATLQEIMPNRMRGQAAAFYAVIANFFGLGFGPLVVALITDRVLGDPAQIGTSLLVVGVVAHVIAAIALLLALKPYRRSLERVDFKAAAASST
ncbi:MAG: MFS transporter [Acidobacteriota bacterium]